MKRLIALLLALILLLSGAGLAEEKASVPSDMLRHMTTEQKIAQLLMPAFYYRQNEQGEKVGVQEIYPEMEAVLKEYGFGGVIFNLQNSQENEKALRQWVQLRDFQSLREFGITEQSAMPFFLSLPAPAE